MTKDEALKMAYKAEETGNLQDLVDAVNALMEALEQPSNMVAVPLDKLQDMQRRLKALEQPAQTYEQGFEDGYDNAVKLGKYLNQVQEPVARVPHGCLGKHNRLAYVTVNPDDYDNLDLMPLYTHHHQWQGLTDDEINEIVRKVSDDMYPWKGNMLIGKIIRAIEQALKEKNHG